MRVFYTRAPANTSRPYVVFFLSGGGARNDMVLKQDANLLVTVKVVANALPIALEAVGRLTQLLDNTGRQDNTDNFLDGGDDWLIQTTTVEGAVSMIELVDGGPVYHEGFQIRLIMEET